MLHAFARNKSKAYTRYLRVRDPSEPRVSSEDEITSLIFGPLDFLSASDNWQLWKLVLQSHASTDISGPLPSAYFSGFSPDTCTLDFWPRKANIEPDLVISFSNGQGETRSLLVELKWDAGLSGSDQLEKQWLHYLDGQQATSLHVFMAKRLGDPPPGIRAWSYLEADGFTASRLRRIRWHNFKHEIGRLAALPDTSIPLKRWCILAGEFLTRLGIRPFVGFHATLAQASAIPDDDGEPLQFWSATASER
jgi:hypothetical protein